MGAAIVFICKNWGGGKFPQSTQESRVNNRRAWNFSHSQASNHHPISCLYTTAVHVHFPYTGRLQLWIHFYIKPVNPKGNQSWLFFGRNGAEAPVLWPLGEKSRLIGEDLGLETEGRRRGITEDEVAGWHHWLNGHEFEQSLQDSGWQGKLVCCSPWGCKESDTSERLNNNKSQEKHSQDINWSLNGYEHSAIVSSTFFIPPHSLWDRLMMLWIRKDSVFLEWTFFHSVNIYQVPVMGLSGTVPGSGRLWWNNLTWVLPSKSLRSIMVVIPK